MSVVRLGELNEEKRIDAEYFKKCFIDNLNLFAQDKTLEENFINVSGGKRLPLGMDFSNLGTPYIRAQDIKSGFTDFYNSPKVNNTIFNILKRYVIENNNIAVTIVGNSIGDIAISKNSSTVCLLTENCAKILPTNDILHGYLYAFLKSKYGQMQITREKVGTAQPKLSLDRIRSFKIRILPIKQQKDIDNIVDQAWKKLQASRTLYTSAENLLLETLGLKDWQPSVPKINKSVRKFSFVESVGRMDAEYFQEKYDEVEERIKAYSGGWKRLGEVATLHDKNITPSKEMQKYIELANIGSQGEITGCTKDTGENLPSRARRIVRTDNIIVSSIEGSLQSCAIIPSEYNDAFCSTGFFVLEAKDIKPQVLLLLLKLPPFQLLLKRACSGTILTAFNSASLLSLPIPFLPLPTQKQIADYLQQSAALQKESKELLEKAKREVEGEIEKT